MTKIIINTFTEERFAVIPINCNLYKILNFNTGSAYLWTYYDLCYHIEMGHFEFEEV